jgi:hypothetical protein
MKNVEYHERPQIQIDLFEVQQEWEWQQRKLEEEKKKAEQKENTVIIIDLY